MQCCSPLYSTKVMLGMTCSSVLITATLTFEENERRLFVDIVGLYFDNVAMSARAIPSVLSSSKGASIPSSYARLVARALQLQERDLRRLLRGTGLPVDVLMPADESKLDSEQLLQLVANAQELSGKPGFGLRLGEQLQPTTHGAIGYLTLTSPTLLSGLEALRDYLPVRLPLVSLELTLDDQWLSCYYRVRLNAPEAVLVILRECFVLSVKSIIETMLGRRVVGSAIDMEHAAPEHAGNYESYMQAPTRFAAERTCYRIPAAIAREPSTSRDPESYALSYELCNKLLGQAPAKALTTAERVRRFMLLKPAAQVNETEVARAMYITRRTLARRLEQEGTGYRQIRETLLAELAARHLADARLTVESVAYMLGYNDAAAFRKAFRRWYGRSPANFRAGLDKGSA